MSWSSGNAADACPLTRVLSEQCYLLLPGRARNAVPAAVFGAMVFATVWAGNRGVLVARYSASTAGPAGRKAGR